MTAVYTLPDPDVFLQGIHIITGPMNSGKSRYLIELHERLLEKGYKVFVVSYDGDTRADSLTATLPKAQDEIYITTRDPKKPSLLAKRVRHLDHAFKETILRSKSEFLLIDEFQFIETEPRILLELSTRMTVYLSCLNGDYKQQSWERVSEIVPYISSSKTLHGQCDHCKKKNSSVFTIRTIESQKQVIIGGSECYNSVCTPCFIKWKKQ